MKRIFIVTTISIALSACSSSFVSPLMSTDTRACVGALIASSAVDLQSATVVAMSTPACSTLTADLLQAALTQALATKAR